MTIAVAVVEHNPILLEGILCLLRSEQDMTIAGYAKTPEEAAALYFEKRPSVILMDLDGTGLTPLAAIRQIRGANPKARIIGLTTYELDTAGLDAIAYGAVTVIAKSRIADTLASAIRSAVIEAE